VIDIAGEASIQMMHAGDVDGPCSTACRSRSSSSTTSTWAWCASGRSCCHGGRYSQSYSESLPDFVKLAEAYGGVGIRCEKPGDLDGAIKEMISVDRPVIFDCVVDQTENCFPMIPSGKAHNEMLLNDYLGETGADIGSVIDDAGKMLV
jgi:acetolactate synthase-1/2/3 large subunit